MLGGTSTGPFKADRGWQVGTTLFRYIQLARRDIVPRADADYVVLPLNAHRIRLGTFARLPTLAGYDRP